MPAGAATKASATSTAKPTVAEAQRFIADSERDLDRLGLELAGTPLESWAATLTGLRLANLVDDRSPAAATLLRLVDEGHQRVNFAIVASGPNAASPHAAVTAPAGPPTAVPLRVHRCRGPCVPRQARLRPDHTSESR